MKDKTLTALFQDQAIEQSVLDKMHFNVMEYISHHPIDFQAQLALHRRRQWSLITAIMFVLTGIVVTVLQAIYGYEVLSGVRHLLINFLQVMPIAWISDFWSAVFNGLDTLTRLLVGIKTIWQHYSMLVMVLLGLWAIFGDLNAKATFQAGNHSEMSKLVLSHNVDISIMVVSPE